VYSIKYSNPRLSPWLLDVQSFLSHWSHASTLFLRIRPRVQIYIHDSQWTATPLTPKPFTTPPAGLRSTSQTGSTAGNLQRSVSGFNCSQLSINTNVRAYNGQLAPDLDPSIRAQVRYVLRTISGARSANRKQGYITHHGLWLDLSSPDTHLWLHTTPVTTWTSWQNYFCVYNSCSFRIRRIPLPESMRKPTIYVKTSLRPGISRSFHVRP